MKKLILIALSLIVSTTAFACPGGQKIELNDVKVLTAYSVYDTEKEVNYMFSDDLEGVQLGMSYGITNSKGEDTHKIFLGHMVENKVSVMVLDIKTNKMRYFKGQYGMMRGCNDIVEYTPEEAE